MQSSLLGKASLIFTNLLFSWGGGKKHQLKHFDEERKFLSCPVPTPIKKTCITDYLFQIPWHWVFSVLHAWGVGGAVPSNECVRLWHHPELAEISRGWKSPACSGKLHLWQWQSVAGRAWYWGVSSLMAEELWKDRYVLSKPSWELSSSHWLYSAPAALPASGSVPSSATAAGHPKGHVAVTGNRCEFHGIVPGTSF